MIKTFEVNPFQVNSYILYDETGECVIVDPGYYFPDEHHKLISFISENKLSPVKSILTHGHIDHIAGVNFIFEQYGLKPQINKGDESIVRNAKAYGSMFGFDIEKLIDFDYSLEDGQSIMFGKSSIEVKAVPGHAPGHLAFINHAEKYIITGDVLFKGSIGRTDLPGGDYDQLMESIFQKLLEYDEYTIYPGHGGKSTIGAEKLTNPFLIRL